MIEKWTGTMSRYLTDNYGVTSGEAIWTVVIVALSAMVMENYYGPLLPWKRPKTPTEEEVRTLQTRRRAYFHEGALSNAADAAADADADRKEAKKREPILAITVANDSVPSSSSIVPVSVPEAVVRFRSSAAHPGLDAFHRWADAAASVYREYVVGTRDGGIVVPPVLVRSERGRVPIRIVVTNRTARRLRAFWTDHRGREEDRGALDARGGVWYQTTWVGRPWVFRYDDGAVALRFVPYRAIPTTDADPTVDGRTGGAAQRFDVTEPLDGDFADRLCCAVDDPVLPWPSARRSNTFDAALEFACRQSLRENASPDTLIKYLTKICLRPHDPKYRRVRIANPTFRAGVWINGGRGVLHALGFEEHGPYVEMGSDEGRLSDVRIRQLSQAVWRLDRLRTQIATTNTSSRRQPLGADGGDTGRGGWRM